MRRVEISSGIGGAPDAWGKEPKVILVVDGNSFVEEVTSSPTCYNRTSRMEGLFHRTPASEEEATEMYEKGKFSYVCQECGALLSPLESAKGHELEI